MQKQARVVGRYSETEWMITLPAESGFHPCRRCGKPAHISEHDNGFNLACECSTMRVDSPEIAVACRQWNRACWIDSSRIVEIAQTLLLAIAQAAFNRLHRAALTPGDDANG